MSDQTNHKALELLDQHRVHIASIDRALVFGNTGVWTVTATPAGLGCTCPARRWCSHRTAAAVAWAEAER